MFVVPHRAARSGGASAPALADVAKAQGHWGPVPGPLSL